MQRPAVIESLPLDSFKTCNYCTIMGRMPVIKRFANCVVRINLKDHAPPHFHIVMNDGREAWVKIDTL